MKNTIGVVLYVFQILAVCGGYLMDRRILTNSYGALSQKSKLLNDIGEMAASMDDFIIVFAGWFGSCFLAAIGVLTYITYLRKNEDRQMALRGILSGICICLISIFWPLLA
jgi:hypothetical protein